MKNLTRTTLVLLLLAVPVAGLVMAAKSSRESQAGKIARGKYLVAYGGCNDCHTPLKMTENGPTPDFTRLLSGHREDLILPPPPKTDNSPWFATTAGMTAWAGPWGISYAANLTPDENTGMGIWTEKMFIQAMRTGKHMSAGRDILPPMAWQNLAALNDHDLQAIFAYLRSIPAIKNRVPEPFVRGAVLPE